MSAIPSNVRALITGFAQLSQLLTDLERFESIERATAEATARKDAAYAEADKAKQDAAAAIEATKAECTAELEKINAQRLANRDGVAELEAALAAISERIAGHTTHETELLQRINSLKVEQARLIEILKG